MWICTTWKRVMSYFSSFRHKLTSNSNYNLSISSKKYGDHDILDDDFKIMVFGVIFFCTSTWFSKNETRTYLFSKNSKWVLLQNECRVFVCLGRDAAFTVFTCLSPLSSFPVFLLLGLKINNTCTSSLPSDNQSHSHLGYCDEQCTFYTHGVIIILNAI